MAKDTCETNTDLSIFWLRRHGYLCGWKSGGIKWTNGWGENAIGFTVDTVDDFPHIRFRYTRTSWDGQKEEMDYRVELTTTPCHFGSKRYWFICPLVVNGVRCRRRVGVLYGAGSYYGCRHCHDLAYESQQVSGRFSILGKYYDLRTKITKEEDAIRVCFWKGRPTKRYARLLRMRAQQYELLHIVGQDDFLKKFSRAPD